ncbi:MAG: phosphoribosylanthranilate isomerase [Pyrinomonadaceae bacterium]
MKQSDIRSFDEVFPPLEASVLIKVCGITNLVDALFCAGAGVDMLGFNFYRRSPRFIEPETARTIIDELPDSVLAVGLFVNEPGPESVAEIVRQAGVSAIQLHGEETPDFCARLSAWPVIKAFRVRPGFDPAEIGAYQTSAILLDAFTIKEHGGTGHTFDWDRAKELPAAVSRLFLAGGLGADNVAQAIAAVRPYAVDTCSRLEQRPGVKDHELVTRFVDAVHSIEK